VPVGADFEDIGNLNGYSEDAIQVIPISIDGGTKWNGSHKSRRDCYASRSLDESPRTMLFIYPRIAWAVPLTLVCASVAINGCSRTKYRVQADREAYHVIAERNVDPRWCVADYSIEIDPRSRYFDPCDPDCPPMPPDDPASHRYMHFVDGKKGWRYWHCAGDRIELENPTWREALGDYVEVGEDGSVKLSVDSALKLAYVHSPSHQDQLETLYLSALDVTRERFRLDTQFFGGYDLDYAHKGSLVPARLGYDPVLARFVVYPPFDDPGSENNRLTVGRPSAANPTLQLRRRFATAGELLVGFANSFVFEFTGGDANLGASLVDFTFFQPLLRGAGKDVALEGLTFRERALLADLRAYSQYRQGFYTRVAIGELGVAGPQRGSGDTSVAVFSGLGGLGGYVGLLQQLQQIRNAEDSLNLQLRTLARLEAFLDVGVIDLVQVDQFRQSIENERANLLLSQNGYQIALDRYKTDTLGLPPDLPVELDDSLIRQFQFVAREATAVQDSIVELQGRVGKIAGLQNLVTKIAELQDDLGQIAELEDLVDKVAELRNRVAELPDDAGVEPIRQLLTDVLRLVETVQRRLDEDIARMEEAVPAGERTVTHEDRKEFQGDREQLREDLVHLKQQSEEAKAKLSTLLDGLSEETEDATVRENVVWLGDLLHLVQGYILVQARARPGVESIGQILEDAFTVVETVRRQLDDVQSDLARMEEAGPAGEQTMTDAERERIRLVREVLREGSANLEQQFQEAKAKLTTLLDGLSEETKDATVRENAVWLRDLLQLVEGCALVQARVHLQLEPIRQVLTDVFELVEPAGRLLDDAEADVARMEEAVPAREQAMIDEEKKTFQLDREQLRQGLADLKRQFEEARAELEGLREGLSEQTRTATTRKMVVWLSKFYRLGQVSILVQARARLETVTVESIELSSQDAFEIALANRLDFMNARAALTDRWRSIQLNADALQSVLNVTASGDIRTARNSPVSFRAPTGSLRLGLEFDAPFTRLLERNDYRESLIDYQRSRRGFIQSRDALQLGLRALLLDIERIRKDLEIQRRAVSIAIRRVDMTQAELYAPVPPPQPGQRAAQFGPTAAFNLLSAQSALRDTQNRFLSAWLNYYAAKMRLARELGIMMLDDEGRWIETPIPSSAHGNPLDGDSPLPEDLALPPPAIPTEWADLVQLLPEAPDPPSPVVVEPADDPAGKGSIESVQ